MAGRTAGQVIGKATTSGLRLVVVGQGETRGRRPHLLRLRESIVQELKTVADGQLYLIVEVALRKFIDELRARPPGVEVVLAGQLQPGADDEHLLQQRVRTGRKAAAAKKVGPRRKSAE